MRTLLKSRWTKAAVFVLSLGPLVFLLRGFQTDALGPNPIEYITRATGDWTMRFLLISLAITPARRLFGFSELINFRRMLGLFAFFYGVLHLTTWVWLDKFFDVHEMLADVLKRRFITAGMVGFSLLIPLAITSTKGWIRRLGKNWTRLHRLVYISAVAGVIHYWWLVKSDIRQPLLYGVILAVLLGLRLWKARRAPVVKPVPRGSSLSTS
jgi:sulfoxide reductase heme-binding subunit YedZ